jgi:plastocyanin
MKTLAILAFTACLPAIAAERTIEQKNREFSQAEITISPGDSLIFKNSDDIVHNVFSVSKGMEFDIRRQAPGESSKVPFNNPGEAQVRCSIHPKMKLTVKVQK